MCRHAWFDFSLDLWTTALTWGSVIVVYSLITVPTVLLCQSIAPEGVSLFSIA